MNAKDRADKPGVSFALPTLKACPVARRWTGPETMADPMPHELQIDGLPGPTTIHGGLSSGNLASQANAGAPSHPRAAARQCLAKMRQVMALGIPQAFLPPLARPDLGLLRSIGFTGSDAQVIERAGQDEPQWLRIAASSAFMWTANCATVIPAADATDGRCHLVLANLAAMPHRAAEAASRGPMLDTLFAGCQDVSIHPALPGISGLGDEGAANHHRAVGARGACHLLVHGRSLATPADQLPTLYPARQYREASQAVARLGCAQAVVHARQTPRAIDAGAFHNDVVMVGCGERLLLHEHALAGQAEVLAQLQAACGPLLVREIAEVELSLAQAMRSYLFNSQMLATAKGTVLLAPIEASDGPARGVIDRLLAEGFLARVEFVDLRESMMGGGGPACLRLRVQLTDAQLAGLAPGFLLTEQRLRQLEQWVDRRYRRQLSLSDLGDPLLLEESRVALDELTQLCGLGALYRFQGGLA